MMLMSDDEIVTEWMCHQHITTTITITFTIYTYILVRHVI